ncbi:MarR family winged helix-turn-helix transcriptional regulator [Microbulbifer mangrovi]|uniref:MarR family winged helix-turn-helix transcriptional regulator n=1 Tax=Microbulbifer mangrovi TaxID=927787 RepID=UPI0023AB40A2|nr:MarR family transcriptional regulator [Microbulbifer mangrovi]
MSRPVPNSPSEGTDSLRLDRQLCFALYASSRAMTRAYQPMLREFGITYPQYLVLLVLWQWDEEQRAAELWTVSALGSELMLDSGTLTPLLKRMEGLELLHRRRSAQDERVTLIEITDTARALKSKVKAWRDGALGELAVPKARLEALHRELWKLLNALQGDS